eukprot:4661794-Amphidinium_carterae.1
MLQKLTRNQSIVRKLRARALRDFAIKSYTLHRLKKERVIAEGHSIENFGSDLILMASSTAVRDPFDAQAERSNKAS